MTITTSGGDAPFAAELQAAAVDVTINSDVRTITVEPRLLDAIRGHLAPSWRRCCRLALATEPGSRKLRTAPYPARSKHVVDGAAELLGD
jgi:hypothetical protein